MSELIENNDDFFLKSPYIQPNKVSIKDIIPDSFESNIFNPLKSDENCILINNKKVKLYKHTYNPIEILELLYCKLNIKDDILDMFDKNIRNNCCNVISISLYFTNCSIETLNKYLISIYQSIKNVKKNLNDWIVRVYFDISVYECINKNDIDSEIVKIFNQIMKNDIVEVYTYLCPSFADKSININKTRILRFIPMSDDDVNICIVREADGIVSNLDCHNIKIFSISNKLFYLPIFVHNYMNMNMNMNILYNDDNIIDLYNSPKLYQSYSTWLQLYKVIFEQEFFTNNQNIYDLLAGVFSIKLKIKKEYYQKKTIELQNRINEFIKLSKSDQKNKINNIVFFYNSHETCIDNLIDNIDISFLLNNGFDEILLLDMFKELISIKLEDKNKEKHNDIIYLKNLNTLQNINQHNILFLNIKYFNLKKYDNKQTTEYYINNVYEFLQCNGLLNLKHKLILPELPKLNNIKYIKNTILYLIDSILIDIILDEPFNIIYNNENFGNSLLVKYYGYLSELINIPYKSNYNTFYNTISDINSYYKKYIKYKSKYLQIKN
jgi:hypothetical protein